MDEPFNGHVRDATSQGHNDTWVNDDVSTSNTREVNEVKGQTGQSRQANDKSSKPSANKKSENSGAKTQPNAARDNISHVIETLADASVVGQTMMTQTPPTSVRQSVCSNYYCVCGSTGTLPVKWGGQREHSGERREANQTALRYWRRRYDSSICCSKMSKNEHVQ